MEVQHIRIALRGRKDLHVEVQLISIRKDLPMEARHIRIALRDDKDLPMKVQHTQQ